MRVRGTPLVRGGRVQRVSGGALEEAALARLAGDAQRLDDEAVHVEVDFHGEDDTRSNMMRLVTQRLTKIVNIPNMKDHGATGATGCLKNVAYGCFSIQRTHTTDPQPDG